MNAEKPYTLSHFSFSLMNAEKLLTLNHFNWERFKLLTVRLARFGN